MQIQSIETQLQSIPLETPFVTALRRVENVEFVRVKVVCENGLTAFGEAPATMAITGEDLAIIENSLEYISFYLLQKSVHKALTLLHSATIGSSAKSALDMAFVSLLAQEQSLELYEYLGAKEKRKIQTDITISLNPKEKMLQDAKKAFANGHRILKIKLGKDIAHAIDVTQTLSQALPQAKLLIDANQAWSLKGALLYVETMQNRPLALIEQPVKAKELAALKKITQISHIPILADEAAFSLADVKHIITSRSADMINIKLMKCGGVTKAVEILEYARVKNVKCMLGSMLEGPISIGVAEHLAMAYSDVIEYVDLDSPLLYKKGFRL